MCEQKLKVSGYASARLKDKSQFVGSYKFQSEGENLKDDWLLAEGLDVDAGKGKGENL